MKNSIIEPKRDTFENLKRDYLFFDKLDFIQEDLEFFIDINITDEGYYKKLESIIADLEFLEERNLIRVSNDFDYSSLGLNEFSFDRIQHPIRMSYKDKDKSLEDELENLKSVIYGITKNYKDTKEYQLDKLDGMKISKIDELLAKNNFNIRLWNFYNKITNSNARFVADVYNKLTDNKIYYPTLSSTTTFPSLLSSKREKVVHLFLKKFPIPDENTPWEKVIDFKLKNKNILFKLRYNNWITDLTYSKHTIGELEQKLNYFTKEYEHRLNLEKIKFSYKSLGFIFLEGLKLIEDIVTFKWSKRLETLLTFKTAEVDLLIGETKAGGQEIAYINSVQTNLI